MALDPRWKLPQGKTPDQIYDCLFQLVRELRKGSQPLPDYTVTTVPPAASSEGMLIYVTNEAGGAVPAFSDGTDWRRVTDRAVIS